MVGRAPPVNLAVTEGDPWLAESRALARDAAEASRRSTARPGTSLKSTSCISSGGTRDSIDSMSPPTLATVGVEMSGGRSPGSGIALERFTEISAARLPGWILFW